MKKLILGGMVLGGLVIVIQGCALVRTPWTKAEIVLGSQACSVIPVPRMWEKPPDLDPLVWPGYGSPGILQFRRVRDGNGALLMGLSTYSAVGGSDSLLDSPTRFLVDPSTRPPKVTDAAPGAWEMAEPLERFDDLYRGAMRLDGQAVLLSGKPFPLTGEHLLVGIYIAVKQSPDIRFVAIASYNGVADSGNFFLPAGRTGGTYFIDIYEVNTGIKRIAISIQFRDISASSLQAGSYWYANRYYVVPLGPVMRPLMFCDIEKLAAAGTNKN